jgi:hypothetical protein
MQGRKAASITDGYARRHANRNALTDGNGPDSDSIARPAVIRQHLEISGAA